MKFICSLLLLIFLWSCDTKDSRSEYDRRRIMPSVDLLQIDSISIINTRTASDSASVVLIFFEPYCQFCRAETESILKNIQKFRQNKLFFISVAPIDDVRRFYDHYKLSQYQNLYIGVDTSGSYMKYFGIDKVPHTTIYSKDKLLKRVFVSQVDAEQLLKYIN